MKILFLGQKNNDLIKYLEAFGDEIISTENRIDIDFVRKHSPEFIISYNYRHIIKKDVLELYDGRAINLHISYLPWNKGADPNFWSLIENTPRGVTIHYLDEGVDTGDIIVQQEVEFEDNDTLKTSYEKLQLTIQNMFKENWQNIRADKCQRIKQKTKGSHHNTKDKEPLMHLLTNGWDTPISILEEYNIQGQNNGEVRKIVKNALGEKAAELFTALLSQKPERADIIVYLQGDQLDRASKVAELYNDNYASTILITGNNNLIGRGKRNEENDFHLDKLKKYLMENDIKDEVILMDDKSMNSKEQAMTIVKLAKEKGWKTLLVVTSPFHILRAYLTLMKQKDVQDWNGRIIMQNPDLPWESVPSGRVKTAQTMLMEDLEKIKRYKSDLANINTIKIPQ